MRIDATGSGLELIQSGPTVDTQNPPGWLVEVDNNGTENHVVTVFAFCLS
jgi:hypothetical protein